MDLAAVTLLLWIAGILFQKGRERAQAAPRSEEKRRADRDFGIVNAVTWTAVFLVFWSFPRLHIEQFVFSALAFLVGIHFFFLPRLYRHRANLVTGVVFTLWSAAGTLAFHGDARIAAVALGSGAILWVSAAWALTAAARLLRAAAPQAGAAAELG